MPSPRKIEHYRAVLAASAFAALFFFHEKEASATALEDPDPGPAQAPAAASPPAKEPRYWWQHRHQMQADLGLGVIGLAYEYMFEARIALQLEANIFGTWFGPVFSDTLPNLRGFGGQVRPTFFLSDQAPGGIYVAPFIRMARVTGEDDRGLRGSGIGWSIGSWIGYSFLFLEDRVNLRVGAGLQYLSYGVDIPTGSLTPVRQEFDTLFPAIDLVVGYRF
jgi:hypothetical protein